MKTPQPLVNLDRKRKNAFFGMYNNNGTAGSSGNDADNGGVCDMTKTCLRSLLLLCVLGYAPSAFAQAVQGSTVSGGAPVAAAPAQTGSITTTTGPAPVSTTADISSLPVDATLPTVADAPPVEPSDPLAEFRRAQASSAAPAGDPAATTPTPGGFQQPGTGVSDTNYNLETALTAEEIALKEAELQQKAREQAFDSALNGMMPMSPDQINTLLDKYKVTREASETRIGGSPKPEVTVQTVSLDPGATPPTIKLSPGHVTSVTMMDLTGQPWPVQDVSWGGNFEVISPGEGGHLIRISPMAAHEVGNMSVQLVGLKTPVTFTLQTQLDVVQYRFDARIPEYGPKALAPIIDPGLTIQAGTDKALTHILDGTPPSGTQKMSVTGVDGRTSVFKLGESMYVRTPLTLLSPGWSASVKSADGMTVYVVNNSPVFLLSDRGKMVRAVVEENRTVQ